MASHRMASRADAKRTRTHLYILVLQGLNVEPDRRDRLDGLVALVLEPIEDRGLPGIVQAEDEHAYLFVSKQRRENLRDEHAVTGGAARGHERRVSSASGGATGARRACARRRGEAGGRDETPFSCRIPIITRLCPLVLPQLRSRGAGSRGQQRLGPAQRLPEAAARSCSLTSYYHLY